MKIGIFGGTFDPVHIGHIISAVEVKEKLPLDKVIFIPARQSPHKSQPSNSKDRLHMLQAAVESYQYFLIDTFELAQDKLSYTFNTVEYLLEKYPEDELYFIMGTDQYINFNKWYNYKKLLDMIHFVVLRRNDENITIHAPFIDIRQPVIEVSSSNIRDNIQNQLEYRHLLPESVHGYIKENNLYE